VTRQTHHQSGLNVLVVDDDPVIASTLAQILQLQGFEAQHYVNPLEALQTAAQLKPDILISEVLLPELSGVELANRLKAVCPECKILLFSAHPDTAKAQLEGLDGVHDFHFLAKPVRPEILLAQISSLMS
jgi:DNA-binding response OmpR family regulator